MWHTTKSYFLLAMALLLPCHSLAQYNETNSTVRVELEPDVLTMTTNCSDDFLDSLNEQIMVWFIDAVANYRNSFPQEADPNATFTNTVVLGVPTAGGRLLDLNDDESADGGDFQDKKDLDEEKDEQEATKSLEEDPGQGRKTQLKCSYVDCNNCCRHYCSIYCIQLCRLCKRDDDDVRLRRYLRRELESAWWWGDQAFQDGVSLLVQFSARQWLFQHDLTSCMGDAWKVQAIVRYV